MTLPQTDTDIWIIIAAMAVGTYLIRFSFLGLIGNSPLPAWALRYLRYTAVSVIPALIAPLVLWPDATGGQPDPARLAAATTVLIVSITTKKVFLSILSGMGILYLGLALLG